MQCAKTVAKRAQRLVLEAAAKVAAAETPALEREAILVLRMCVRLRREALARVARIAREKSEAGTNRVGP